MIFLLKVLYFMDLTLFDELFLFETKTVAPLMIINNIRIYINIERNKIVVISNYEQIIDIRDTICGILYNEDIVYVLVGFAEYLYLNIYQLVDCELIERRIVELNIVESLCSINIDESTINIKVDTDIVLQDVPNNTVVVVIHCLGVNNIKINYGAIEKYYFTTTPYKFHVPCYFYKGYIVFGCVEIGIVIAPVDDMKNRIVLGKGRLSIKYTNSRKCPKITN